MDYFILFLFGLFVVFIAILPMVVYSFGINHCKRYYFTNGKITENEHRVQFVFKMKDRIYPHMVLEFDKSFTTKRYWRLRLVLVAFILSTENKKKLDTRGWYQH